MALHTPRIHCVTDAEPIAFHDSDLARSTFSFATNLSLECPADAVGDISQDEQLAEDTFKTFLNVARKVEFHVWLVSGLENRFRYIGKVAEQVSEERPLGVAGELLEWLREESGKSDRSRYWSKTASQAGTDTEIDVRVAGASDRLRAAQSWNAPVAHKFFLTHVLRLKRQQINDGRYVVLPYFANPGATPAEPKSGNANIDEIWDISYNSLGGMGPIECRTGLLIWNKTFPLDPRKIDDTLTSEGYLRVDPDAENLRRATKWFEDRAASLMSAGSALAVPVAVKESEDVYSKIFRSTEVETGSNKVWVPSAAAAWYVAAALCSSLDALLIGILKPISGDASEGEILAPLVTALLQQIEAKARDNALGLDEKAFKARTVTAAVRAAIKHSPLAQRSPAAAPLVDALRYVLDVKSTLDVTNEMKLINALLEYYRTGTWKPSDAGLDSMVAEIGPAMLAAAVAEIDQKLHDEAGAEATLVRFIETSARVSGKKLSTLIAENYLAEVGQIGNQKLLAVMEAAVEEAWSTYRALLAGPFNGAEALRRSAGSEFLKSALSAMKYPSTPSSSKQFSVLIEQAQFYSERLLRTTVNGCFDKIASSLPSAVFPSQIDQKPVREHLVAVYADAVRPLGVSLDRAARFIPDNAPHPLPIQIASNIDGAKIDEFGKFFNGIAVAVRRIDEDKNNLWAHANLADLTWDEDDNAATNPDKTVPAAIHPMLPALSDGRGPMFIEYEGFPFANTAFLETMLDNGDVSEGRRYRPFYRHNAADYARSSFASVPRLAYGRKFESFSFVTSNAGTLPLHQQLSDKRPWMPKAGIEEPQGPFDRSELVGEADYQRRTAIGQMAVLEIETRVVGASNWKESVKRRIGAPIEGVAPLSGDYPRIGLFAEPATVGTRDIFREGDGRGAMIVGSVNGAEVVSSTWTLDDVRWTGTPNRIVLRLFNGPASEPDANPVAEFPFDLPQTAQDLAKICKIAISIKTKRASDGGKWDAEAVVGCGSQEITRNFSTPIECLWLRVVLQAGAKPACMSFGDTGSHKPNGVDAPLLILAPDEAAVWKDGLPTAIKAVVQTPRVGFLDFERWFSNEDLRREAFEIDDADPDTGKIADRFERALLAAYVMRHLDEQLAASLDRLPDPAVEQVRIELAVLDRLVDRPAPAFSRTFSLKGFLLKVAKNLPVDPDWTPKLLMKELFEKIEGLFKFTVEIGSAAGDPALSKDFKATLPPGLAANLSIDALVPEQHFWRMNSHPEVFDPGLLQYASRRVEGGFLAFPSAAIRVETMLDAMAIISAGDEPKAIQLAADLILPRPVERSRHYDIVTGSRVPEEDRRHQWRLLGEIDVTTQRWRPTGKPIYHYVNPKAFPGAAVGKYDKAACPAVPVALDSDAVLARFETEAFFDRPDIDAQTVTKKLLPLPSMTVLQQHFWDAPSATYFRHRFTLRSRYAGALRRLENREARAWITNEKKRGTTAHAWTMRVAMLADLSRILLTRPQLRALIPLTTAPGAGDTRRPAPPILSILQEPPFARGGLADRIASEIKTGFGYGFAKEDEPLKIVPVEILDSRKEIGPTAYLDYCPLNAEAALGMALTAEGPIGLTFDQVNAPAPAFPNSMLVLSPTAVAGEDRLMEEHFFGVSMRRYIDPAWTMAELFTEPEIPADQCWWIGYGLPERKKTTLLGYKADNVHQTLLMIEESKDRSSFLIKTKKAAVDGVAGILEPDVEIARLRKDFADAIVVLHQPIAPGRYSTSVLALPKRDSASTMRGRSNAPLMLAGFEWSPPKTDKDRPIVVTLDVSGTGQKIAPTVRTTMASAPTAVALTRTSRDFDFVHTAAFDGKTKFEEEFVRVTSLVAKLSGNHEKLTFARSGKFGPVWLCPSTFFNKYPIHVHRHLAVLTTRHLDAPGRPVEVFCRSAILAGATAGLIPSRSGPPGPDGRAPIYRPPENCVRVVEFESPAAILCGTDIAIPETYKTAYFDLVSTGFKTKTASLGAVRLLFRFAGSPTYLRNFKKLTIAIWDAEILRQSTQDPPGTRVPSKAVKWELDLKNEPADQFTTGVELLLGADSSTSSLSLLRSDGTAQSSESNKTLNIDQCNNLNPGLFVAIITSDEFWTDVSLLHSPEAKFPGAFDFTWLFSQAGEVEPAVAVTPEGLKGMLEAQARIVSVSPPIPIVSHDDDSPALKAADLNYVSGIKEDQYAEEAL